MCVMYCMSRIFFFVIITLTLTCFVLLVPVHTHTGIRPTADGMYSLLGGLGFFFCVIPKLLVQLQRIE